MTLIMKFVIVVGKETDQFQDASDCITSLSVEGDRKCGYLSSLVEMCHQHID